MVEPPIWKIWSSNWIHLPQIFRVKMFKKKHWNHHLVGNFWTPKFCPIPMIESPSVSIVFLICHSILPSSRPNSHPTHEECTNCPTTCYCRFHVARLWHNSEIVENNVGLNAVFKANTMQSHIINYGSPQHFPDTNAAFIYIVFTDGFSKIRFGILWSKVSCIAAVPEKKSL